MNDFVPRVLVVWAYDPPIKVVLGCQRRYPCFYVGESLCDVMAVRPRSTTKLNLFLKYQN